MDIVRWMRNQWERSAAIVGLLLGVLVLYLGWRGVSHEGLPAGQLPYLASGGLLGLFVLGASATLWLSADLRDEWRKLEDIHTEMQEIRRHLDEPVAPAPRPNAHQGPDRRAPLTAGKRR